MLFSQYCVVDIALPSEDGERVGPFFSFPPLHCNRVDLPLFNVSRCAGID